MLIRNNFFEHDFIKMHFFQFPFLVFIFLKRYFIWSCVHNTWLRYPLFIWKKERIIVLIKMQMHPKFGWTIFFPFSEVFSLMLPHVNLKSKFCLFTFLCKLCSIKKISRTDEKKNKTNKCMEQINFVFVIINVEIIRENRL